MKRFVGLAIVCSLIIGLSISCQRPPSQVTMRTMEDADHVVAKGKGGLRFTLEQLYRSVARTKAEHNGGIYDSSRVRRHLDSMLVDSLIGLEAHQVDVQKYRKPWRTFNAQRRTVLVNEFRQANIYDVFDLDSADVIEFYNEREDLFVVPELAYIYHVSVSEPDLRAYVERTEGLELKPEQVDSAAEVRINDIYDQISDRETFLDQVVKHRATEVPFTRAGDLGWTRHDQYLDPFDSVAFALDSGMYSEPYRDDNGWNVLYCDGRIPAGLPPLDDTLFQVARVTLQTDLANKRAPVVADSLAGLIDLTLRSDGLLDSNVYLVDRWEWAAIINDRDTIFFADLRGLEEKFRHRYGVDNTSAQMKEEMAEMLAGSYVTTYVAEDQGLDTLPPMKRLLDSLYHVYQKGIMLRDLEIGDWTPTDSAIEAYYQAHIDEYQFDKPLVVQQIVVSDSVLAEFVRDQATAGYQFMDLARDYHEPDTTSPAFLAADLGAVGPDDIPPDIYRAMRAAPLRVPSNLYHSDFGWHLFYVLERHRSRTLLDATGEIKLILKDQKEREIFTTVRDSLFEQYNVSTADKLPTFHLPPYTQRDPVFE